MPLNPKIEQVLDMIARAKRPQYHHMTAQQARASYGKMGSIAGSYFFLSHFKMNRAKSSDGTPQAPISRSANRLNESFNMKGIV